jgi:hypothetical protein
MFLNCVDELTPAHLRILKYFENPEEWLRKEKIFVPNYSAGGASTILYTAFPELKEKTDFATLLINDLSTRGLSLDSNSMNIMTTRSGMFAPRITNLGRQFLQYITSPIKE